ncbi:MAG: sporulation protein YtfJ [Syntrophomonadaceae bacterium]|nr:sporulation protein YtfJ [Syntrophomonadaceae bacterium]
MDTQQEKPNHPIEGLMKTAMEAIKQMVDVNTVVGDAVETNDGSVIIPISQVACGFGAGGGEYEALNSRANELPFGGGAGAGVSVKPVGFLVVRMNEVRLISVNSNQLAERVVDTLPGLLDKWENIMDKRANSCRKSKAEYEE